VRFLNPIVNSDFFLISWDLLWNFNCTCDDMLAARNMDTATLDAGALAHATGEHSFSGNPKANAVATSVSIADFRVNWQRLMEETAEGKSGPESTELPQTDSVQGCADDAGPNAPVTTTQGGLDIDKALLSSDKGSSSNSPKTTAQVDLSSLGQAHTGKGEIEIITSFGALDRPRSKSAEPGDEKDSRIGERSRAREKQQNTDLASPASANGVELSPSTSQTPAACAPGLHAEPCRSYASGDVPGGSENATNDGSPEIRLVTSEIPPSRNKLEEDAPVLDSARVTDSSRAPDAGATQIPAQHEAGTEFKVAGGEEATAAASRTKAHPAGDREPHPEIALPAPVRRSDARDGSILFQSPDLGASKEGSKAIAGVERGRKTEATPTRTFAQHAKPWQNAEPANAHHPMPDGQNGITPGLQDPAAALRREGDLDAGNVAQTRNATSAGELFASLDRTQASANPVWTHAGMRQAEAGFHDPEYGWVSVQARSDATGIHAVLVPPSIDSAHALHTHLAGLNGYLATQHGSMEPVTIAAPETRSDERFIGQGLDRETDQRDGQNEQADAQSGESDRYSIRPVADQTNSIQSNNIFDRPLQVAQGSYSISVMA
jgi:hypothetical protein